ncbi:hypothetical protein [Lysinibacillus xylanilyticus]|uniref:hypothetical protein n=1 Tax=Lysinibacillus xylanilyticus TaxID=582475 RepID=UPI003806D042
MKQSWRKQLFLKQQMDSQNSCPFVDVEQHLAFFDVIKKQRQSEKAVVFKLK